MKQITDLFSGPHNVFQLTQSKELHCMMNGNSLPLNDLSRLSPELWFTQK